MIYVLDTNVFIVLTHYYPSTFQSLWARLNKYAETGVIISVREVLNELNQTNDAGFLQTWVEEHKYIFKKPTNNELLIVQRILAVPHFQEMISKKALLRGTPVADPFVIAAAKSIIDINGVESAAVVTQERDKPNAAKIPNVCKHVGVPYMNLNEFMTRQCWVF